MGFAVRRPHLTVLILVALLAGGCASVAQQWTPPPCSESARQLAPCGPYSVEEAVEVLHDAARGRDIAVKVYRPARTTQRFPLILFSHGIGNSHEGYRYLGRHWASYGFVSVHLNHEGTNRQTLLSRGRLHLARAFFRRSQWRNRLADLRFVADRLERGGFPAAASGDPRRLGVAGHSLGALTVLEAAEYKVPEARAVLAMSPPAVGVFHRRNADALIGKPTLYINGGDELTYDEADGDAVEKEEDVYVVELPQALHETFSDDEEEPVPGREQEIARIQIVTTEFWEAYLKGDSTALEWLASCAEPGAGTECGGAALTSR